MNPSILRMVSTGLRLAGAAGALVLVILAIVYLRRARSGLYYVVREESRTRGLRLLLVAVLVLPVTLGPAAYVDRLARQMPTLVAAAVLASTPTQAVKAPTISPLPTATATLEPPTETPTPRPTVTPLPTATATSTRIPPTDLPPTLLTPLPSAVPAAEDASFGPIQLGAGFVNRQLDERGVVFPLDVKTVHATFQVRNMNRNAPWTAAWYREGKYVAGDPLLWDSTANITGHVFYGPSGGFLPGRWELRLYIEDRLQNKAVFTIVNATSTPSPTPAPTITATPAP